MCARCMQSRFELGIFTISPSILKTRDILVVQSLPSGAVFQNMLCRPLLPLVLIESCLKTSGSERLQHGQSAMMDVFSRLIEAHHHHQIFAMNFSNRCLAGKGYIELELTDRRGHFWRKTYGRQLSKMRSASQISGR